MFGEPLKKGETFGFEVALHLLKFGLKVARKGWNGKQMWIALTPGSVIPNTAARVGAAQHLAQEHEANRGVSRLEAIIIQPHIDMRAADGSLVPGWLCSQTDMLAEDWVVVS